MALKVTATVIETGKLQMATPNDFFRKMICTCESPNDSWNGTRITKNGHALHVQRTVHNTNRRKTNICFGYKWMRSEAITPCIEETVDNKAERNTARGMFEDYLNLAKFRIAFVHSRFEISLKPEFYRSEIRG
ncbi:hypothetical protein TNCV_2279491 [Trichonephila clavipes]|uniref:Uncharacterized protein n=1 Tax=Trichonephila clavipes TaxID=2585209 RepID=A0A8X6R4X6_TRICX|nr:hypothetical protein TNCV_2279491 [Trichonephila clavipes]